LSQEELWVGRHRDKRMVTLFEKECDKLCGAHWMVKSSDVSIQYMSSVRYATIQGLAIGGPFLQGHSLVIDSKGLVTWDGARVADSTTRSFDNDLMSLHLFEKPILGGGMNIEMRVASMKIELPSRVSLTVNLGSSGSGVFKHFLDVFITMPIPASGTDGYCGDADGDVEDENRTRVYERAEAGDFRVAPDSSLFDRELSHQALLQEESAGRVAKRRSATLQKEETLPWVSLECQSGSYQEALFLCSSGLPEGTSDDWLDACAIDVCVGGEQMLEHTAMLATQSQEIVEAELVWTEASMQEPAAAACHTCALGDACFNDVSWAMRIGIPSGHYAQLGYTPAVSESSCFEEVQGALRAWQSLPDFVFGSMSDQSLPAACQASSERHSMQGLVFCR